MLLYACPDHDEGQQYITIVNKSDRDIVFQELFNWADTMFYCSDIGTTILLTVHADSTRLYKCNIRANGWEDYLNKGQTMSIYIADEETYDKYWKQPCDTIHKYVPVLHRYQLKLKDLQQMNWTVVYPPEE
ncbi:hypothetical protein FACS1894123_12060 [Bacteroidia bacterium]|nr:hypothetical protein FACS1894123_12060 [Bacteroidia bacterium]